MYNIKDKNEIEIYANKLLNNLFTEKVQAQYFYNQYLDYFAGEFFSLSDNIEWTRVETDFFRTAIKYGKVFVGYEHGKFILLIHKHDSVYYDVLQNKEILYDKDWLVEFKWGINNFNYYLWSMSRAEYDMFKAYYINLLVSSKKYQLLVNTSDVEVVENEIKNLMDVENPFYVRYNSLLLGNNQIPNEITPLSTGQNGIKFEDITAFNKYWTDKVGYSTMLENKKERLLSNEVETLNHNTFNYLLLTYKNLLVFSYDIKQKFNIELKFNNNIINESEITNDN